MAAPKIKDTELQEVLQQMEADLQQVYEQEKDRLVKAEGDGKEPEKDSPPAEASDSASPSASPEASDAPPPPPAPDASASPPAPPGAPPSAPADPAAADAGAPLTPEALQAEYAQLAPEELDMHIKAALAAKEALAASAVPAGPPAPPPAAAPPSPSPSPSAPPPAMKAELKVDKKAIGGQIKKSEGPEPTDPRDEKLAALEALTKSQAEDIENLTKAVKIVLEQPLRKAVTSVAFVPKTEPEPKSYTKEDVQRLIKDGAHKLNKTERDLVLDFYDGRIPATKLEPVLEKLTASK